VASYPVSFDVERPRRFERAHIVLRLILLALASVVGGSLFLLVYFVFPLVAAIVVSQKGGDRYLEEDGPRATNALRWVVAVTAYLLILTDRFPAGGVEPIRYEVQPSGSPTAGSALLRILYAVPSALVLSVLGVGATVVWVAAAILVLVTSAYPAPLWRFLRGVVRWQARLLAYLASLVEPYPPFRLDPGDEPAAG